MFEENANRKTNIQSQHKELGKTGVITIFEVQSVERRDAMRIQQEARSGGNDNCDSDGVVESGRTREVDHN